MTDPTRAPLRTVRTLPRMGVRKRLLFAIVAVLGCGSFALVLGELAVRRFARQTVMPTLFTFDQRTGHRLRPNAHARHVTKNREFDVEVATNSHGWRSPELDHRPKILALGDSFTFGTGVSAEETFAAVLERQLNGDGHAFQVVNVGVGGWTPDQYWAEYHYSKSVTNPRLVVVGFYEGNDFVTSSPLISFSDDGQPRFHLLRRAAGIYGVFRSVIQGPAYDWLAQHSHLAVLLKNTLYGLVAAPGEDERTRDPAARYTLGILRGLHAEAAADGVKVVIVIIPERPEWQRGLDRERTNRLVAHLEASGIPCLDLRPLMGGRSDFYFHIDDLHWNAEGHAVAGRAIHQFLATQYLTHHAALAPAVMPTSPLANGIEEGKP